MRLLGVGGTKVRGGGLEPGFGFVEEFKLFQGSENSILNPGSTWVLNGLRLGGLRAWEVTKKPAQRPDHHTQKPHPQKIGTLREPEIPNITAKDYVSNLPVVSVSFF